MPKKTRRSWWLAGFIPVWILGIHIGPRLSGTNPFHTVFGMLPTPVLILPPIASAVMFASLALRTGKPQLCLLSVACLAGCLGVIQTNVPGPTPLGKERALRVLTINVHLGSRKVPELLSYVKERNVDLIFLQENFGDQDSPATFLHQGLPGWHLTTSEGVAIVSRHPITRTSSVDLNDSIYHALLSAQIDVNGTLVRAIGVQWSAPQSARTWNPIHQAALNKQDELRRTINLLHESPLPTVMAGDFNTPPRHQAIQNLEQQLKSCFRERGEGTGWTYPNRVPIIALDHMFVNEGLVTLEAAVTPKLGSDHRGLICDLALR